MKKRIPQIKFENLTWICIENASFEDIQKIEKKFKFHHLDLEDCLEENQRSKIDKYPDYNFIILHLPRFKGRGKKYISSLELNIFVGEDYLITLHDGNNRLNELFNLCKNNKEYRSEFMAEGSGYLLYNILNDLFEKSFILVDDLTRNLNNLEKEVFTVSSDKDMLKDILRLKKDIINFRRIIFPQRSLLAQLEHIKFSNLDSDLEIYFDNIVDKIEKIYSTLESLKELVESVHQTNEAMMAQKTNNVIRVLTVFSVIMLPLTLISGIFGMNVNLPNQDFGSIIISMCFLLFLMLIFFKRKGWL